MRRSFKAMLIIIISAAIMFSSFGAGAAADDIVIFINNIQISMDVPPMLINNRTMIPVRAVSEAIGCEVKWIEDENRVDIYPPNDSKLLLSMFIDHQFVKLYKYDSAGQYAGEEQRLIDAPPVIVNDRTLVPLRFIAEALDFSVDWMEYSNAVILFNEHSVQKKFLAKVFPTGDSTDADSGYLPLLIDDILMITSGYPEAIKRFGLEGEDFLDDYVIIDPNPGVVEYNATTRTVFNVQYDGYDINPHNVNMVEFSVYINDEYGYYLEYGILAEVEVYGNNIVSIEQIYTP